MGFEPYQSRTASVASEHVWFRFNIPSPASESVSEASSSIRIPRITCPSDSETTTPTLK